MYGSKEFLSEFFLFWMFCPLRYQFLEQRVKVISLMGRNGKQKSLEKFKLYLDVKDILLEEVKTYNRKML